MASSSALKTLGDFVELQRGTTYKGALLDQSGPVLLGLASISRNGGFRDDNLKTYGGESDPRILLGPDEIYVSLKDVTQSADLLGAVARVPQAVSQGRLTQDTVKLVFREKAAPTNYIYWLLRTPQARAYCRAHATGTTNLGLPRNDFLAFPIPELSPEREHLTDLLQSLEDKIELNRQMNETLEAVARAIFKSWFVDFDPVRAKMEGWDTGLMADVSALFPDFMDDERDAPKGWRYAPLSELTSELRRGIAPKYIEHGGVRVINQRCIRDRKVSFDASRRHDTEQRAIDGREIEVGDILINSTGVGTLGRVGQVWTLTETTVADSHVTVVRAKDGISNIYLGLNLLSREVEIESLGEGSTGQTELSRTRLGDLPILVPCDPVLEAFDKFADPVLKRISASDEECRTLASLRDLLLPKLVSGEVRIGDAERLIGG